uniref:Transposase n=1 Tax=Steinernema glaseri TaxID=37863 RepID=A0A1I7YPA2_9BILA
MRAASKKQYERKKNRSLNFMKITTVRLARVQEMLKKSQKLMRAAYALPRDFDRGIELHRPHCPKRAQAEELKLVETLYSTRT